LAIRDMRRAVTASGDLMLLKSWLGLSFPNLWPPHRSGAPSSAASIRGKTYCLPCNCNHGFSRTRYPQQVWCGGPPGHPPAPQYLATIAEGPPLLRRSSPGRSMRMVAIVGGPSSPRAHRSCRLWHELANKRRKIARRCVGSVPMSHKLMDCAGYRLTHFLSGQKLSRSGLHASGHSIVRHPNRRSAEEEAGSLPPSAGESPASKPNRSHQCNNRRSRRRREPPMQLLPSSSA
jgi:hypothetical protein